MAQISDQLLVKLYAIAFTYNHA